MIRCKDVKDYSDIVSDYNSRLLTVGFEVDVVEMEYNCFNIVDSSYEDCLEHIKRQIDIVEENMKENEQLIIFWCLVDQLYVTEMYFKIP